jgi:EmrB/QacA subfamily drug resistance transporter
MQGDAASRSHRAERATIAAVALTAILAPLNTTMIAVALPSIIEEFDSNLETAGWLVTGYLIALAALQPVTGKLGDRLGRRPLMLIGLVAFAVVSIAASFAPNIGILIVLRVLQAVSGAIVLPNGLALLREVISVERRAASFGLLGAAIGIAAGLGPIVGGLMVAVADWRAVFYINVPLIVLGLFMVWRVVPARTETISKRPFDLVGSLLLSGVLVGSSLLVLQGLETLPLWLVLFCVAALAVALVVLARHELRHADPVMNPAFLKIRAFAAASSGVALSNMSFYTLLIAMPIVLASNFGWSTAQIGLGLTLLTGPTVIFAPIGGRLADRLGRRAPAVAGLIIATAALAILAAVGDGSTTAMLAVIVVAGAGFGLALASHQAAAVEAVPATQAGAASGVFSTSRYLGSIVGSLLLATLLVTAVDGATTGFRSVIIMSAIAALLATAVSVGLPGRNARELHEPTTS